MKEFNKNNNKNNKKEVNLQDIQEMLETVHKTQKKINMQAQLLENLEKEQVVIKY